MSYRGFSILYDDSRGWYIRLSVFEEWLATSKENAMKQVDDYLARSARLKAA